MLAVTLCFVCSLFFHPKFFSLLSYSTIRFKATPLDSSSQPLWCKGKLQRLFKFRLTSGLQISCLLDMAIVKLEIHSPQNFNGISPDPEPDWSFEALLSELDFLEKKLYDSSSVHLPFTKMKSREFYGKRAVKSSPNAFIMRISDDDIKDDETLDEEDRCKGMETARRFNCNDLYLSDDSDDDSVLEIQPYLMSEVGLVDVALFELNHEHQLGIKEEIRSRISALQAYLVNENEKFTSACAQIERYREQRQEAERKVDVQYQRKVAEGLDNHLTTIQREHELKSQIEERRLRSDAAYEEAKRKEKAIQEERQRQEKAKAEAEMQAKLRAEEAKKAALEAEMRAAREAAERKEAAEREAVKNANANTSVVSIGKAVGTQTISSSLVLNNQSKEAVIATKKSEPAGNVVRCSETGLLLEQERLKKLKEFDERNQSIRASVNKDFSRHERLIARLIRQIRGTKDNVKAKASEIVNIINSPECPQSISTAAFAKKVVSHCESPDNPAFACSYVIVLVTSQFPHAMDLLLAEFHRACIYTVPKHMVYSESAFGSREAYHKAMGYREDDGKLESTEDYLKRVESYMKLYGALVQTEIAGIQNIHGLKEGWVWLARFLNSLPANMYTAVALYAFLQMAGFGLFRRYRSQFKKLLNIVLENFVHALRAREDPELIPVITGIQSYVEDEKFLREPEGRALQDSLLSRVMVPDSDWSEYGY